MVAALAGGAPRAAGAGDAASDRASLAGIRAFRVVVERLPPETEKAAGLRRDDLQAHLESSLARAGIGVAGDAAAILYLNVALACNGISCAYTIGLEVQQQVRLERRPAAAPAFAATWSTGSTGLTGRRAQGLRDRVRDEADRFAAAYRSVNPR
jgi:hypothetical protein